MKKYLIAFAAMAVALSSCTEKMSSGDNVPDGGDKVPEKTKLVKRITETSTFVGSDNISRDYISTYDFSYDSEDRIIRIIYFYEEGNTNNTTETWSYSENAAEYHCDEGDGDQYSGAYSFEKGKVSCFRYEGRWRYNVFFLYADNSEKVTSLSGDWEEYRFVWDKNGNMISLNEGDGTIQLTYTDRINKSNLALEYSSFAPFPFPRWIDRNVFGSICCNYLIETIDWGYNVSHYSYKFDEEGYPIEVYVPGGVYDTPDGGMLYVSSEKYEIEYY